MTGSTIDLLLVCKCASVVCVSNSIKLNSKTNTSFSCFQTRFHCKRYTVHVFGLVDHRIIPLQGRKIKY